MDGEDVADCFVGDVEQGGTGGACVSDDGRADGEEEEEGWHGEGPGWWKEEVCQGRGGYQLDEPVAVGVACCACCH